MNKILKKGQLVRMIDEGPETIGLSKGDFYEVKAGKNEGKSILYVESQNEAHVLSVDNELTDLADYFAIHNCPVILPKGNVTLARPTGSN